MALHVTDTVMLGGIRSRRWRRASLGISFFVIFILGSGFAQAVMPMVATALGAGGDAGSPGHAHGPVAVDRLRPALLPAVLVVGADPARARARPGGGRAGAGLSAHRGARHDPGAARHGAEKLSRGAGADAGRPVGHHRGRRRERRAELDADLRQSRRAGTGGEGRGHRLGRLEGPDAARPRALRGWLPALRHFRLFQRFWRPDWTALARVFRLGWPIGLTGAGRKRTFQPRP